MAFRPIRGQVVSVYFPVADDKLEVRPALVVQNDYLDTGLDQTIFAMITTSTTRADLSTRILIKKESQHGQAMGIRSDSVIVLDTLAVMKNDEIERTIGTCPRPLMEQVDEALKYALGLT